MNANDIKELRASLGLTQQQLADRLYLSVGAVRDWEQGRTSPGKRSMKDIEKLLKSSK